MILFLKSNKIPVKKLFTVASYRKIDFTKVILNSKMLYLLWLIVPSNVGAALVEWVGRTAVSKRLG